MPRLKLSRFEGRPLLDIATYARLGPSRRDRLSPAEVAEIARTVGGAPEVVVKVLPRGSTDTGTVRRHLDYISRHGGLELETDEGETISNRQAGRQLVEDWDLDLDEDRGPLELSPANGRKAPKLVHKLILSMPPGTPPDRLHEAARGFLREEFASKHRYTFVLHTDEPHPHVHAVIKAIGEKGARLHIDKATLRRWRNDFANHLRGQGVEANATECAVRGQVSSRKLDGIYRAARRGESTHMRNRVETVLGEMKKGAVQPGKEKATLTKTRSQVLDGWIAVSQALTHDGHGTLAGRVIRFAAGMAPPYTEGEQLAAGLLGRLRQRVTPPPTR